MRYDWNGKSIITMHNLSKDAQQVELNLKGNAINLQSLLNNDSKKITNNIIQFSVDGYNYNWWKLK